MRVLALVTDGFGASGGIARYNTAFLTALAHAGAEVLVVPRYGHAEGLPQGVGQRDAAATKTGYALTVLRLLLSGPRFDIVWCGHINLWPVALLVAAVSRCPVWLQIHGIEAWDRPGRVVRRAVARVSLVTAVSRYTRRRFLSWADLPAHRVRVLPNSVDLRFTPGPKPAHLVARYGLEGRRILLTIARLSAAERYKGHDRVIRLLPGLVTRFPDVVYVIGGDGDDRVRLEALAEAEGVAHLCHFIGPVAEEELVEHYRMADLFVMPSTGEGFGIVFLEAMACGTPAIGLDADGSVDPLSAHSLGQAVDDVRLGEAIERAFESDETHRRNGTEAIRQKFGRESFESLVQAIYRQLCQIQ